MPPLFIAHRGLPFRYPENSLLGFDAAMQAGATWLECDVQLTKDQVPILVHDADLARLCGREGEVGDGDLHELQHWGLSQPDRFASRFRGVPITTLRQLLILISRCPQTRLFLELKSESARKFGTDSFVDQVLATLAPFELHDRVIPISFADSILHAVQQRSTLPIGWVTASWDDSTLSILAGLNPDYFFIDQRLLERSRAGPLAKAPWHGRWQTVVYTVNDPARALLLDSQGYTWQETDHFDEMTAAF